MRGSAGDVVAGAAVGGLVGLLVGLSMSQIAGAVVASLTALLAAFFGLRGAPDNQSALLTPASTLRMGAFGLACAAAILAGLYTRTHDLIGMTVTEQIDRWQSAGYSAEEARRFVVFERLGLVPEGQDAIERDGPIGTQSFLFAGEAASRCDSLARRSYANDRELLNAFRNAGEGWDVFAETLDGIEPADASRAARAALVLVCGP